jgi:DNA-directed RNA polymerase specialized sigma24 family protein
MLDPDPRIAQQSFDRLKRRVIFRFQHNLSSEAEDLAQETISRVLKELREVGPAAVNDRADEDLTKFTFGVARNVATLHYLRLLEHKSRALEQAAPLAGWQLPDCFRLEQ